MTYQDDIIYTVRSIEKYTLDSDDAGGGTLRLACRNSSGSKVWIELQGITLGQFTDYVLYSMKKD